MKHSPGFIALVEAARLLVKEISVAEVRALQSGGTPFHFIDVREDHEWAEGHAQGARHIGRGILERDIEHEIPDKRSMIVLTCGGGYRSVLSAGNLQRMGYTRAFSMAGGFRAWTESGGPVTKEV